MNYNYHHQTIISIIITIILITLIIIILIVMIVIIIVSGMPQAKIQTEGHKSQSHR